jgi:cell division transport system ATP-binding protein
MRYLLMITFNQVTKRYPGGFEALSQINFNLNKGEMAFLTGHSGAGKSTVLRLITRQEKPSSGQIVVGGDALTQLKPKAVARYRHRLGIIFQSPKFLNDRTVFDNVALPLLIEGLPQSIVIKRAQAALDRVGLLNKEKIRPHHLSCGEQQRVAIARAIVHKPDLIIADEPTGNLDPKLSADIMNLFSTLNEVGVSVLIATHDLALIAGMKHRIIMLKGGRLC